jgi:hypothetical protein
MALGSTRPLTEMSTRNLPRGKERPVGEADNLSAICEPTVKKMWQLRRPNPLGLHGLLQRQLYLIIL